MASFIQHEQAVHVKRRRHFLGALLVRVGRLIKLRHYFQCCFYRGQPAFAIASAKSKFSFFPN